MKRIFQRQFFFIVCQRVQCGALSSYYLYTYSTYSGQLQQAWWVTDRCVSYSRDSVHSYSHCGISGGELAMFLPSICSGSGGSFLGFGSVSACDALFSLIQPPNSALHILYKTMECTNSAVRVEEKWTWVSLIRRFWGFAHGCVAAGVDALI